MGKDRFESNISGNLPVMGTWFFLSFFSKKKCWRASLDRLGSGYGGVNRTPRGTTSL